LYHQYHTQHHSPKSPHSDNFITQVLALHVCSDPGGLIPTGARFACDHLWSATNSIGGAWLPTLLDVKLESDENGDDGDDDDVVVKGEEASKQSGGRRRRNHHRQVVVSEFVVPPCASAPDDDGSTGEDDIDTGGGVHSGSGGEGWWGAWSAVESARSKEQSANPARWLENYSNIRGLSASADGSASGGGDATPASEVPSATSDGAPGGGDRDDDEEEEEEEKKDKASNKGRKGRKGRRAGGNSDGGNNSNDDTNIIHGSGSCSAVGTSGTDKFCRRYELIGIVSHVKDHPNSAEENGHLVCHVLAKAAPRLPSPLPSPSPSPNKDRGEEDPAKEWVVFNDFAVSFCSRSDAVNFHEQVSKMPH
jgi:hypothetical protein